MGKAIYQPKGKAQEYNQWAVNFYNGCSGKCTYCYNRKGRSAKLLGKDEPTIKKSLVDEETAIKIFEKEVIKNLHELQEHGLFFNFVSDPFLPETMNITRQAVVLCNKYDVPCILLTKQTSWLNYKELVAAVAWHPRHSVGFTLTGHDELEPGCSTNIERINVMRELHLTGIQTWASIEPIIDLESSVKMISNALPYCNHFKIGLESGKKYDRKELEKFVFRVNNAIELENKLCKKTTVYWKESIMKKINPVN